MASKRARRLGIAAAASAASIVIATVVVVLSLPTILHWIVVRAARARGVELVVQHVEPGWGWVRLRDARLSFQGVDAVHATIDRATIDLQGMSPTRVEISGLDVAVVGSAADVLLDVTTFAEKQSDALRFPVVARDVSIAWREREGEGPWLEVTDAFVAPVANGSRLRAETARVLDVNVGPVGATWSSDGVTAALGFGQSDLDSALLRVDVPHEAAGGLAHVTLRPVRLANLQRPLGVALPIAGNVIVSGDGELALRPNPGGSIEGKAHLTLEGYVPPHPRELDGIVFGDKTTLDTRLMLTRDRKRVQLSDAVVAAGAFKLHGGGTIDRLGDHGLINMTMSGPIACQALARSAVGARLPGPIGQLVGDLVTGAVQGSVQVSVSIQADTRDLAAARINQSVGIGCGLRLP